MEVLMHITIHWQTHHTTFLTQKHSSQGMKSNLIAFS